MSRPKKNNSEEEKKVRNFSIDMNDWWEQIKEDDVAIFERYAVTQKRAELSTDEDEDEEDNDEQGQMINGKTLALYNTPWGPVKVPEFCDIDKHFKLWTMYTKKPIGKNLINSINKLSGVETLELLTPYRARIGICPLYKDGQVLNNILIAIKNSPNGLENMKTP